MEPNNTTELLHESGFMDETLLEELIILSNYYGKSVDFVIAGGGNTSVKTDTIVCVKASGSALRTLTKEHVVFMDRSRIAETLDGEYSADGSIRESQVKNSLLKARLEPEKNQRPSVETFLHHLFPQRFVVHTHPYLVNAILCSNRAEATIQELFGEQVLFIPYTDPGFTLSKRVEQELARYMQKWKSPPDLVFLENHGVIIAGDSSDSIHSKTQELIHTIHDYIQSHAPDIDIALTRNSQSNIDASAMQSRQINYIIPCLRGVLEECAGTYPILKWCNHPLLDYLFSSHRLREWASHAFNPDQIVYCKESACMIELEEWFIEKEFENNGEHGLDEDAFTKELLAVLKKQVQTYMQLRKMPPKVILIPGMGMISVGASMQETHTIEWVYLDALKILYVSHAFEGPKFLTETEAGFIENWEAEQYRRKVAHQTQAHSPVEGKVALITGSGQGIGKALAMDMAAKGAWVVIADINKLSAVETCQEIKDQCGMDRSIAIETDVMQESSIEMLVQHCVQQFGGLDIVISNAGILYPGGVDEVPVEGFRKVTEINYIAYFTLVKHATAIFKRTHQANPKRWFDIVYINSKSGLQGSKKNSAYSGSKFGATGLTQSFALELVDDRIKVNSLCLGNYFGGPLWSDPQKGLFVQYLRAGKVPGATTTEEVKEFYEAKIPMKRGLEINDILKALYYIIDQEYETGQSLTITGGQVMLS